MELWTRRERLMHSLFARCFLRVLFLLVLFSFYQIVSRFPLFVIFLSLRNCYKKIGDISSLNVINLSLCSLPHPLHYLCGDSMEMLCLKQTGTVGRDSETTREKMNSLISQVNVQFIKFWSLSFVKQNATLGARGYTRLRLKKRIANANASF